jgi:hypothetical protein
MYVHISFSLYIYITSLTFVHITCQFSVCSLLFLTSMRVAKQYVSTGIRGQDSLILYFSKLQKQNCIVSFNYYFQYNYTWIWYNITTLVTLSILNSRLKNPFSWHFDKVGAYHQSINQSINRFTYIFNACAPSLVDDVSCISTSPKTLQCMLDVCSEYSRKWYFRFNAK